MLFLFDPEVVEIFSFLLMDKQDLSGDVKGRQYLSQDFTHDVLDPRTIDIKVNGKNN